MSALSAITSSPPPALRCLVDMSGIAVGSGITYARNLLPALATAGAESQFLVLVPPDVDLGPQALPVNCRFLTLPQVVSPPLSRVPFLQVWLPLLARRHRVDVLYSSFDYSAPLVGCPMVLAIHNISPYAGPRAPGSYGQARETLIRILARLSARRARSVLFVSRAAETVIRPRLGIEAAKCHIVYYGLSEDFRADPEATNRDAAASLPEVGDRPYLLTVSSVAVHKDLETLLLAFGTLVRRAGISHALVVAGPVVHPEYERKLRSVAATCAPPGRVVFLGPVPHRRIPALYRGATVTVVASRAETFGMPLAEAMASGVPTVASNIPALREVGADGSLYYEPGDHGELARTLGRLLTDLPLCERLRRNGMARARIFSWPATAAATYSHLIAAARADGQARRADPGIASDRAENGR